MWSYATSSSQAPHGAPEVAPPPPPAPQPILVRRPTPAWVHVAASRPDLLPREAATPVTPLLKYPGGKAKLASNILAVLFPDGWDVATLVEPFAGPASVAHTAIATGFRGAVVLNDLSPIVACIHREVAAQWPSVRWALQQLPTTADAPSYFAHRDRFNALDARMPAAERAALYLWLNRTCFNGLHRFSRNGFNADYGKKSVVPGDLMIEAGYSAHARYQQVACLEVSEVDFAEVMRADRADSVIYCDPPYLNGFDNYTPAGFKVADHIRLAEAARDAADRGHRVGISGVDSPVAREVYAGADRVVPVGSATRAINRDGGGRAKKAAEVLYLYGVS